MSEYEAWLEEVGFEGQFCFKLKCRERTADRDEQIS